MQNGVLLMGAAAIAVLFYTQGNVTALVVMYSINVFLTFSLSQLGMCASGGAAPTRGGAGASRSTASRWCCASAS